MANYLNVFISSTSNDLKEHRQAVIQNLLNDVFHPVNMEGFTAAGDNALQVCYNALQRAEIFVGIYAYRYGFCPPKDMGYLKEGEPAYGDGKTSITEWEYRWAIEKGIPIYLFVAETDNWDEDLKDSDQTAIKAFRAYIGGEHVYAMFDEHPATLTTQVVKALAKYRPTEQPQSKGSPPHTFRPQNKEFFDRVEKQAELTQAIDGRARVVGVYGRGGIGKTGLVSYILEGLELKADAVDGLVYRTLEYSTPDNAPSVSEIVEDFNQIIPLDKRIPLASTPPNQHLPLLLNALRDKHYVLLLDNFESVQDAKTHEILSESVRELIETVLTQGGLTVIVTTRHRFPLPDLTLSSVVKWVDLPEGLPLEDAKAFMRSLEGSQHLPTDENELERFINYVQRIPRGLQVGMGWLNEGAGHTHLRDFFDDPVEQEEVIGYISGKVIDALGEDLQRVLGAIAICHEPASLALLTYLLSPYRDSSAEPLKKTIKRLITSQLILVEDGRYTLYPFDRDYCLKTLPKTGADDAWNHVALNRRAIAYYQSQRPPKSDWRTIADLHPHLMEFEHHFALGDYDQATLILQSIDYEYLLLWGHAQEVKDYHLRLEGKIVDLKLQSICLNNLGLACADLGEMVKAIGYYENGLKISREIGYKRGEGNCLGNLGVAYANLGEVVKAIGYYEDALKISRKTGDKRGEGSDLGNLGIAYADLGEVKKAIGYYEEALKISREIGDKRGEGSDLGNLGVAYKYLGEVKKAIGYYEEALKISREIGDKQGEGSDLSNLGNSYADLGDVVKAIEYHEEALKISREIGDKRGEGICLGNLGNAYRNLGDLSKAIGYYEEALKISREIGDKQGEGIRLGNLGLAYDELGDLSKALDYFKQALEIARTIGNPQHINHWENAIEIVTGVLNNGE